MLNEPKLQILTSILPNFAYLCKILYIFVKILTQ